MKSAAVQLNPDPARDLMDAYWFVHPEPRIKMPRVVVAAKDMHYYTADGRAIVDATSGLWCTNAGHNREPIVQAIQQQAARLVYAPSFQFTHPAAFEIADRVARLAPDPLNHVFFCNSGSEAVDTASRSMDFTTCGVPPRGPV